MSLGLLGNGRAFPFQDWNDVVNKEAQRVVRELHVLSEDHFRSHPDLDEVRQEHDIRTDEDKLVHETAKRYLRLLSRRGLIAP